MYDGEERLQNMNPYIHKLKIGNLELENNLILAPMAGVTDKAYRIIHKAYGPGLICSEMVSSRAIYYGDEKTKELMNVNEEKRPIAIQIFGNDPTIMGKATEYVSELADIVDINAGCPAPKIVKNGDGSKLLLNLDLLGEILETVRKNTKKPVTVKIRKGWDDKNIVAVEAAKIAEKLGVDAITIHGRTREQYYSGQVDIEIIKQVKQAVSIPVIGNGDIRTKEEANAMFAYTNVDGIMIGRASLGNPWIWRDIIEAKEKKPSNKERLEVILKHLDLEIQLKGENVAVKEMRKQICWYIKNLKNSSEIRKTINQLETEKEVKQCLVKYFDEL